MARLHKEAHERRQCMRIPTNARVMLIHSTIGEITARTRDISDSGVFVEIYPVPRLPVGAHIKMNMLDSSMPGIAFNMKVTRTTHEGLGLWFVDFELDGERYSMDMLQSVARKKK